LSKNLNLENYINFIEYSSNPEIYFKNISLHIFPTISESFGLVMCEAKIYGITTILVGLDYVYLSDGGIINVYDDTAESISIQAIKILNNTKSREKFGNEARKSMKIFNNNNLYLKWIKVILSIFNGDIHYQKLRNEDKILSQKKQMKIITNQLKLLKMRKNINFTIQQIENFTYLYFYHY
jgi:glycosyltransferase involved in cell wall biosynthesis